MHSETQYPTLEYFNKLLSDLECLDETVKLPPRAPSGNPGDFPQASVIRQGCVPRDKGRLKTPAACPARLPLADTLGLPYVSGVTSNNKIIDG